MTLEEAEKKYPYLLTCNFIDLIMVEQEHIQYLARREDAQARKDYEAIKLIKGSRIKNG